MRFSSRNLIREVNVLHIEMFVTVILDGKCRIIVIYSDKCGTELL